MVVNQKGGLQRALDWIEDNWVGKRSCPICEGTGWFVGEYLGEVKSIQPKSKFWLNGGSSYPMIVLSCENCGYSLFFNAIVAGMNSR